MIKNKIKIISIGLSSLLLSGCVTNVSTNLSPQEEIENLETKQEKKDEDSKKSIVNMDEVQKTINEQNKFLKEHGLKEKVSLKDENKVFPSRKELSKENMVNYLNFKREQSKKMSVENVTINVENVDVKEAFKLIADVSKKNIVLGEEVSGTISAELNDISWEQALETLLKIKGLVKHIDGDVIRIHKPETLLKLEEYDRERISAFKKEIQLKNDIEPLQLEVFKLYYIQPKDVAKQLDSILTKLEDPTDKKGSGGVEKRFKITMDERTRSVIIEAPVSIIEKASTIIKSLDVKTKQVLIEAFIVEASDNFSSELETGLGINLLDSSLSLAGGIESASIINSNINPGMGNLHIIKDISTAKLNMAINALESKGFAKTLANPKFFTMNNKPGMVMQGSQLAYVTRTSDAVQTIFKDAVLKLEATPNVIGDGNLILDILVTKDRPEKLDVSAEPGIAKMEIKTQLLIQEGDIAVIGGVYEEGNTNSNEKTPFLGDIPMLGNLFQNKNDSSVKKELIILITAKSI